jgi:hypothetical protein
MNPIAKLFLFVVGPALALVAGCLGIELIEETFFGWLLFCAGAGYPPGAVIYYQHYKKKSQPLNVPSPGSRPASRHQ